MMSTSDRNPVLRLGHSNRALLGHFSRAPKADKNVLLLEEKVEPSLVNKLATEEYAADLTDDEVIDTGLNYGFA